ncbi:unnamed protein product [Rangifer tarandus platyrhynchus]|uniref:Uncharacterized protein n=2 Tax=Rangifer tarandus platyrhynchus TaxID=3082113 RepID=A0ACB0DZK2_RANTA|nr:unnamed protein product [Rangifer tarandus platyrhynchus]CAI9693710.1 unnamed protein product [Rangifer tarandus platyrhynchus]
MRRESRLSLVTGQLRKPEEMRGLAADGERAPSSPGQGVSLAPLPVCERPPPDRPVPTWVSPRGGKTDGSLIISQAPAPVGLSEKQKALRSPQRSSPPVSGSGEREAPPSPAAAAAPPVPSVSRVACFLLKFSLNQTLQPLSPPSDDGPAASHPQGEPFEGVAFPSGERVFVEGPGSSGRPRWDPPSTVAWRGQPAPSLLGSSRTVSPAKMVPTWSVHAGRGTDAVQVRLRLPGRRVGASQARPPQLRHLLLWQPVPALSRSELAPEHPCPGDKAPRRNGTWRVQ